MNRLTRVGLDKGGLLAATLVGCAAAFCALPASAQVNAEVVHAYTGGGDAAAIKVLADHYNAAGGHWVDIAIGGFANAQAAAMNMTIAGDAPAAVHYGLALDLVELEREGLLNNVDDVATAEDWDNLVLDVFKLGIKVDDHWVAVPTALNGVNFLWHSDAAFKKAGIESVPKNWDEFFAALDKLKAAGLVPLAVGGLSYLEQHLFNFVLLERGGADLYLRFYRDGDVDAVRSPEFLDVLETFGRLREYGDPNSPGRSWDQTIALLIKGEGGFHVAGEWVKGAFTGAGQVNGVDFGCDIGLGSTPLIVGGDILAFPKSDDADVVAAQKLLAKVIFSPEVQKAFNDAKGAYSPRKGVLTGMTDPCAQQAQAKFDAEDVIAAGDVFVTAERKGAIRDALTTFWNSREMTPEQAAEAFVVALQN